MGRPTPVKVGNRTYSSLTVCAELNGLSYSTLATRLRAGMSIEEALTVATKAEARRCRKRSDQNS